MSDVNELDHACKNTCSGWQNGYDEGAWEYKIKGERLLIAARSFYSQMSAINEHQGYRFTGFLIEFSRAMNEYENK